MQPDIEIAASTRSIAASRQSRARQSGGLGPPARPTRQSSRAAGEPAIAPAPLCCEIGQSGVLKHASSRRARRRQRLASASILLAFAAAATRLPRVRPAGFEPCGFLRLRPSINRAAHFISSRSTGPNGSPQTAAQATRPTQPRASPPVQRLGAGCHRCTHRAIARKLRRRPRDLPPTTIQRATRRFLSFSAAER